MTDTILLEDLQRYTFSKSSNDEYFLEVLCGSIGMYEVKFQLNEVEVDRYLKEGEKFINDLVWQVNRHQDQFKDRFIK